ncbi:PrsW family glutamic-type intramembrane protease [Arthrobacter alpinus]|uniref:PrsW family glutamic-type intramembrane protease n=1 Tax=Arthrobacter alpinus TaxID=656366 RepID=UPI00164426D6|nr:PrsW family glutamic-type intramembrane protease [Arthrobacter alpinus]
MLWGLTVWVTAVTLRAILPPVGHVMWTAIFGAALFAVARGHNRYRFRFSIILTYVVMSLLHALWDSMSGITSFLALILTGTTMSDLRFGFIPLGSQQGAASVGSILYVAGVALTAAFGIVVL